MPSSPTATERIQEEAALWFARLRGDEVADADRAAFHAWIAADARHRREYEALEQLWDALAQLRPQAAGRPKRNKVLRRAATLAVVALAVTWLALPRPGEILTTAAGERKHVQLADGSVLDIAPNTRLRVRLGAWRRRLDLDDGRMAVAVAADSWRPFEVAAGGAIIRDIGTRFDVAAAGEQVRVVVAEGAVEVSLPAAGTAPRRVGAGEGAEFDRRGALPARRIDATAALAWTKGQLVFDAAALADVVAELNRYRTKPIELADSALANIRISGVFLIDDEDAALNAISRVVPVEFISSGTVIEVRRRRRE